MPTIDFFNGIKIRVYNGDHNPPHIHAEYNEFEVVIVIINGDIYSGCMPNKQLKLIKRWLGINREWILSVFYELNPNLK